LLAIETMTDLAIYEAPEIVEPIWRHLESLARPPYVQSWGWVENWLAMQSQRPPLLVIHDDTGAPLAAAFDGMPLLRAPAFPALGLACDQFRVVVDREVTESHVDLDTVRAVEGGYLATLSPQIRAHLAHARRLVGDIEIEAVTDGPRCHAILDELLELNGARDDQFFRRLIDQRAPYSEIQLQRIRANDRTLGCFYNITWHDQVCYQLCAFASIDDADLCHAAAIEHAAAGGFTFYQLQRARTHLATGSTHRVWLRLEHAEHAVKLAG
jgi:hypothetical protein